MTAPVSPIIACFSWNSRGVRMCKTAKSERGYFDKLFNGKCDDPTFINKFIETYVEVTGAEANIVAISTEDENKSNSYFHSTYLPTLLSQFDLYKTTETYNVGELYSILINGGLGKDSVSTGVPTSTALRLSVYVRKANSDYVADGKERLTSISHTYRAIRGPYVQQTRVLPRRMMGSVGISLEWKSFGDITILAFSLGMAPIQRIYTPDSVKVAVAGETGSYLNAVLKNIDDASRTAVVLMGDMATTLFIPPGAPYVAGDDYIPGLLPGYTPLIPAKAINWKLLRSKADDNIVTDRAVDSSVYAQGIHDRYFVKTSHKYDHKVDIYSKGTMTQSDHAGVALRLIFKPLPSTAAAPAVPNPPSKPKPLPAVPVVNNPNINTSVNQAPPTAKERKRQAAIQAAQTANQPAQTANQAAQTANQPAQTANQPAQTANQPAQTANQPAQTANQPAQTANQPAQSTVRLFNKKGGHRRPDWAD
jgi:hypothetical protein